MSSKKYEIRQCLSVKFGKLRRSKMFVLISELKNVCTYLMQKDEKFDNWLSTWLPCLSCHMLVRAATTKRKKKKEKRKKQPIQPNTKGILSQYNDIPTLMVVTSNHFPIWLMYIKGKSFFFFSFFFWRTESKSLNLLK